MHRLHFRKAALILLGHLAVFTSVNGAKVVAAPPSCPPETVYQVGVAQVDITPAYPVRLSGFGFRRTESEGVTQPIWAKALAIDDGKAGPAVLITVDNLGVPDDVVAEIASRLEKQSGLKRERLAVTATHT